MNKKNIEIRNLVSKDFSANMLDDFDRYQEVKKVYRVENGNEVIKDTTFIDNWDESEIKYVINLIKSEYGNGGVAIGVFDDEKLIGFALLASYLIGENKEYVQLLEFHISKNYRSMGLGKKLFNKCIEETKKLGASKLYISSHSSISTVKFYRDNDCVSAKWLYEKQVELEPCDVQLEYRI